MDKNPLCKRPGCRPSISAKWPFIYALSALVTVVGNTCVLLAQDLPKPPHLPTNWMQHTPANQIAPPPTTAAAADTSPYEFDGPLTRPLPVARPTAQAWGPQIKPVAAWPLKVVSWHLKAAERAGAIDITPPPQLMWRHTFGAEIRPASRARFDIATLDADVVLVQGVRLLSDVRLLFPATTWNVLASRQRLQPVVTRPNAGPGWGNFKRTPTTAVAIRYQRGVRMTGREHITQTAIALDTTKSEISETAAAVTVRLRIGDESIWLVSADLPDGCSQSHLPQIVSATTSATTDQISRQIDLNAGACAAYEALAQWSLSRPPGERLIIGGPNTAAALAAISQNVSSYEASASATAGKSPCPRQQIAILEHDTLKIAPSKQRADAGCIARLDVMGTDK